MGRRLEGGDQIPDPSIDQTAKVVAGGVGVGEERKAETGYEYNSTAVHNKFDLNLGDLRQSTKVKRSGWQRVSPLTAHHSSTLTSGAGGGGWGSGEETAERFRRRRRSRQRHHLRLTCFKSATLMA